VRCTADLLEPGGERTSVPAWGPDEETAQSQALRWARIVAAERFHDQLWSWILWGEPDHRETARARLAAATSNDPLRVPEATFEVGACQTQAFEGAPTEGWRAGWSLGDSTSIARQELAAAIETARRRACMLPYLERRAAIVAKATLEAAEEGAASWSRSMAESLAELRICLTQGAPLVERAPLAHELVKGRYQCRAVDPEGAAASGWSSSLELAAELAQAELVYSVGRRSMAQGLETACLAAHDERQGLLASAHSTTLSRVTPGDDLDLARVHCTSLPEEELALEWVVRTDRVAHWWCGPAPWSTSLRAKLSSAAEARDQACLVGAYADVEIANDAVSRASSMTQDVMAAIPKISGPRRSFFLA